MWQHICLVVTLICAVQAQKNVKFLVLFEDGASVSINLLKMTYDDAEIGYESFVNFATN